MANPKGKRKKKKSILFKIILGFIIVLLGIVGIFAIIYGGTVSKLRKNAREITAGVTADTFREIETSIIYDVNGNEITSLSGTKELYYLSQEEIPDILKKTFVMTEDKDFYNHKGVDLSAIVRAVIANAKSNSIEQGASTITQQLARNMFLSHEVTWERKITEMFVAMELENKFSKNQILEFYINNIYFANGYYGIEAAAEGYFGKTVNDLSLSQLIFLAGIPNNPWGYDPVTNFDSTIARRDFILKQLFAEGYITNKEYQQAVEEEIVLINSKDGRHDYIETYVFYCATRALMKDNGFVFQTDFSTQEEENAYNDRYAEWYSRYQASLFTGGYRIYTSIDMDQQNLLQQCVNENMMDFTDTNEEGIYAVQAAAVCIDNTTGLVTAIVGGREQDYDGYTLNRAYQSYRQPGSSIKPIIVYTPYFMMGHYPNEPIADDAMNGGPANSGDYYRGLITIKEALAWSSNVCAWKIMEEMTPEYGMAYLHLMNFKKTGIDDNKQSVSIGGFTYGVSPVELASAYATLENDGMYREPSCIQYISDAKGNIVVSRNEESTMVYNENSSRMTTKCLEYGVEEGLLTRAKLENAVVAAKSGTTNDNKDGWLAGYSAYYTTVVWVGADVPVTIDGLSGGSYPLDIWKEYMEKIHEGLLIREFPDYVTDSGAEQETTENGNEPETDRNNGRHPGYGDNTLDIDDGDRDIDVNGMGDKDAR